MEKFIYVYSSEARDKLIAANYKLLKSDDRNRTYVFLNENKLSFEKLDVSYILSDVMTF